MSLLENLQNDVKTFLAEESATAPLLKRVLLFLEDGEFTQADAYCEKVLDMEPENALAYLGKLMAARRISSVEDLSGTPYTVDSDSSFKKAVRFAPDGMKEHLHALNMQIYTNCIAASRNRARIHMSHGELKETAQQYHTAMKLWEDSKETLPDAEAIYNDLANEVADFNWKLLLHNRQCPDDQQLIARSIPIDTDRWYLSAVKWADAEKKAYFESVAKDTLWGAHLKCMDAIKAQQTKLAQIWAGHYKTAAKADDPLPQIQQSLIDTNGFTQFAIDAPAAMLKLIGLYTETYPAGVEELKSILQDYYVKIFQSLLDFTGKEPIAQTAQARLSEDTYFAQIAQQEALACDPNAAVVPVPADDAAEDSTYTDPVWATESACKITAQMVEAVASNLSPYGTLSTYLVAAKELTIRYGKKDGIVTDPHLFRFICQYYTDALSHAQGEQATAIQTKFNDFLIETVRLPSATTEIVSHASACMQGSTLPYQIYLSRLTNNYSVEMEVLIPTQVTEDLAKWQRYLDAAKPKRDCYWLSDQQENIQISFAAAEKAIADCRQYTEILQKSLDTPYQEVLTAAGEDEAELSSGWNQKMLALQNLCDEWANTLAQNLATAQEINSTKLVIAQKQIKLKEALQLSFSIAGNLLLLLTILVFAIPLIPAVGIVGWGIIQQPGSDNLFLFYGINIGVPVVAGILSLLNAWAAPTYGTKRTGKLLWLYMVFGILTYVSIGAVAGNLLLEPEFSVFQENLSTLCIVGGALALCSVIRTLMEFFLCKMRENSRNNAVKTACRIGGIAAKVAGLAQALVCFCIAGLFVYTLIVL